MRVSASTFDDEDASSSACSATSFRPSVFFCCCCPLVAVVAVGSPPPFRKYSEKEVEVAYPLSQEGAAERTEEGAERVVVVVDDVVAGVVDVVVVDAVVVDVVPEIPGEPRSRVVEGGGLGASGGSVTWMRMV